MLRKRGKDEDIKEILKAVRLDYLVDREGGMDAVNDWNDVLSGKTNVYKSYSLRRRKAKNGHGSSFLPQAPIRYSW